MKRRSLLRLVSLMSFLLPVTALATVATTREASACGTAVYREIEDTAQLVAQAEQALSEGKLTRATYKAVQAYPALKIVKPGTLPLADRALRILALASVRSDGALTVGTMKGKTATDRASNLEWSVDVLRGLN